MKGLIYNNLISVLKSKTIQILGLLFVLYLILDAYISGISIGYIFIYITGALSVSFFGISGDNESLVWNNYEATLPVSRKKIILSKFISSLILMIMGFVVAEVFCLLVYFMHYKNFVPFKFQVGIQSIFNIYMLFVTAIWLDITSPFTMKFGVVTGKIIAIACLIPIVYTYYFLGIDVSYSISAFFFLFVITAVITAISYFICCKIYENKEF